MKGKMQIQFLPAAYAVELYGKFYLLRQFDKSVDHYATEFSNLFIRVGLNETIDQLRARYLVSLDLSIGDELGMVCVYNLEDARCYDLQAEKRVLFYGARRPLSSRVDGVSKGSYCGKETASSSKGLTANLEAERQSEVVQEVLSVKEVKSRRGDARVDMLMKAVGKDSTSLFSLRYTRVMFFSGIGALDEGSKLGESISYLFSLTCVQDKYHAWVNAEFLLEKCLVGTLDDGEGTQTL
ncbi:hypothetical protein Golob_007788 [Gossypium lobatum]|uniref:Retrotransposon gag domain-containing protein n=1 Tax=Gossypium lobatum TaxID=34289 RepID=A0A7J8MDI6_9ROSI|nr:hypothetical protein [Gossypium lobatum]